jgi:hypothetical protein
MLAVQEADARWRGTFQPAALAMTAQYLRQVVRDVAPIHADGTSAAPFPVHDLAGGGAWVVDIAPLPQRAAQAVLATLVDALVQAKTAGRIPADMPLVLLIDDLPRWAARTPRLLAFVRDQQHRQCRLIGLAERLSMVPPRLAAYTSAVWIGRTSSQEARDPLYAPLPPSLRCVLPHLSSQQAVVTAAAYRHPLLCEIPHPAWLVGDEGAAAVAAAEAQRGQTDTAAS